MYFSGKISNAFLVGLLEKIPNLEDWCNDTLLPEEFLKDPTSWLNAQELEQFLSSLQQVTVSHGVQEDTARLVGHNSVALGAWGALDGVLKLMTKAKDVYTQPQKFLSYFISPSPPIRILKETDSSIHFEIPIAAEEFPLITEYLRCAMEAIPTYMGLPLASVEWTKNIILIDWKSEQSTLDIKTQEPIISTSMLHSLIQTIEQTESLLAEKNQIVLEKEQKIQMLKGELEREINSNEGDVLASNQQWLDELQDLTQKPLQKIYNNYLLISDYFTRAQQLVTLLLGETSKNKSVDKILERMNWSLVKKDFLCTVQEGIDEIESVGMQTSRIGSLQKAHPAKDRNVTASIDLLVERALSSFSAEDILENRVKVNRLLFCDKPAHLNASRFVSTLQLFMKNSFQTMKKSGGNMRILTRPRGRFLEVEIADSGPGLSAERIDYLKKQDSVRLLEQQYGATVSIMNHHDGGSTYLLNIPV